MCRKGYISSSQGTPGARAFCFGVGGHVTSENNVFNSESRKLYVNFMCCELICADWSTHNSHVFLVCGLLSSIRFNSVTSLLYYTPRNELRSQSVSLSVSQSVSPSVLFLAHLSWKLKWAFLITCRPSSVCL